MFTEIKDKVLDELENWGMPESLKTRKKVELKDATGIIDKIITIETPKLDKTGTPIFSKKGVGIMKTTTFIAFDGDKVFVCISNLVSAALKNFESVIDKEGKSYPSLVGTKFKIGFETVEYANKKSYQVPVILDA